MKVLSLGGSGEDSRNCFLVQYNREKSNSEKSNTKKGHKRKEKVSFLLDCGVRREIAQVERVYPLLTQEIAKSLDAVFISHAHEDHTAALPYLYELGFRGKVYCTQETASLTPSFMKKWANYVLSHSQKLPFDEENIDKIEFSYLELGKNNINGLEIETGRSGHVIGGIWLKFKLEDEILLYTGDTTLDSLLLERDTFPKCTYLICDSAYAKTTIDQKEQYEKLYSLERETQENHGKVLYPVPANGRGIDIALYLSSKGCNISTDSTIINNAIKLYENKKWIKKSPLWQYLDKLHDYGIDYKGSVLVSDGMLTSAKSIAAFNLIKENPACKTVITGHAAKGTIASSIFDKTWQEENNVKLKSLQVTIKVHPDKTDVIQICKTTCPQKVMLFHSKYNETLPLIDDLQNMGYEVICGVQTCGDLS